WTTCGPPWSASPPPSTTPPTPPPPPHLKESHEPDRHLPDRRHLDRRRPQRPQPYRRRHPGRRAGDPQGAGWRGWRHQPRAAVRRRVRGLLPLRAHAGRPQDAGTGRGQRGDRRGRPGQARRRARPAGRHQGRASRPGRGAGAPADRDRPPGLPVLGRHPRQRRGAAEPGLTSDSADGGPPSAGHRWRFTTRVPTRWWARATTRPGPPRSPDTCATRPRPATCSYPSAPVPRPPAACSWPAAAAGDERRTDRQRNGLAVIRRNTSRLTGMADELLTLARAESHARPLDAHPIRLADLVAGVVATMQPAADRGGLELRCEVPAEVWVEGDAGQLERALLNLLGNAVKFTPPGGRVTISAAERRTGGVQVAVSDTGIGIPEAE